MADAQAALDYLVDLASDSSMGEPEKVRTARAMVTAALQVVLPAAIAGDRAGVRSRLELLPPGSVVTDVTGEWWQRSRFGWLYHGEGRGWADAYLSGQGPLTVAWVPPQ